MADLSFSFHWSQASSAIVLAASAVSAVAARSAAWDGASAAAATVSSKIAASSAAWDAGAAAASKASDASSAIVLLDAAVIKSIPGTNSRAIHEIQVASNGQIHFVYSSNAAA